MNDFVKNTLKILQVLFVLIIPALVVQYFFPQLGFLGFAGSLNAAFVAFFSQFTSMTINGMDCTIVFLIIPSIVGVIASGIIINVLDDMEKKIKEKKEEMKNKKIIQMAHAREKIQEENLQNKHMVYMTIAVVFSKFTISNLTDREVEEKKAEVKRDLLKDLDAYNGKVIESEAFDDDDTFAVLFLSQDDALTFISKFQECISYFDNITQVFGYSIAFKALVDLRDSADAKMQVLAFMEKALNAIELNEICATNDFVGKYKIAGKMKNIVFVSKGNYSINKSKVELNKVIV